MGVVSRRTYVAILGRNQTLFCCAFEVLYHRTSVEGGAHMYMCCIDI